MYGTNENPGLAPRWFLSVRVEPGLWIFNGFRSLGFGGFGLWCEASVEIDKKIVKNLGRFPYKASLHRTLQKLMLLCWHKP